MGRAFITLSLLTTGACLSSGAGAFENTKVLPKGVRSVMIKSVASAVAEKTSGRGKAESIAKPLAKDLTFKKVLQGEKGIKKTQLHGFLLHEGFDLDAGLGTFSADMKGSVAVVAPVMSYGLSERLTLAFGIPYYQAAMGVELGFRPSALASDFVGRLQSPAQNQVESAREAAGKINDAVGELNRKLSNNGYRQLKDWQGSGWGDATLAAKYRMLDGSALKMATTAGAVLPTGRQDQADILNDIPFGKGSYDAFAQVASDQYLTSSLFVNEYAKYSYSFAGKAERRMATEDEVIEVEKRRIAYKLGNRFDAGASLQYEPAFGLVAGLGYVYSQKPGDRYTIPADVENAADVRRKLQGDTHQRSHHMEARLGYSTVGAFQRGEFAAPLSLTLEYKRHLASTNTYTGDFVGLDLALFF